MTEVTVHITLPRQLWDHSEFAFEPEQLAAEDALLGKFIRTAAAEGLRSIEQRLDERHLPVEIRRVEITLERSVQAELA